MNGGRMISSFSNFGGPQQSGTPFPRVPRCYVYLPTKERFLSWLRAWSSGIMLPFRAASPATYRSHLLPRAPQLERNVGLARCYTAQNASVCQALADSPCSRKSKPEFGDRPSLLIFWLRGCPLSGSQDARHRYLSRR